MVNIILMHHLQLIKANNKNAKKTFTFALKKNMFCYVLFI